MIPTPLRNLTNNLGDVEVEAKDILDLVIQLEAKYPGMGERLLKGTGVIRPFINIYVNDEDIRFMDKEATKLKDGDTVSIIPSIAGGLETIKLYMITSINESERYTIKKFHGVFATLTEAKDQFKYIWENVAGFDGKPNIKEENRWVQTWGTPPDDTMNGFLLLVEEIEANKIYNW